MTETVDCYDVPSIERTYYTIARWTEDGDLWVSPLADMRWYLPDSPGLLELVRLRNRDLRAGWEGMPKHYQFYVAKVTETTSKTVERVE